MQTQKGTNPKNNLTITLLLQECEMVEVKK